MHAATFTANDGTLLAYQTSHPLPASPTSISTPTPLPPTILLLLHGFSGSSQYFHRNIPGLTASSHLVITPDLRGHGASQHTRHGHHTSRLAADLHDLLSHLRAFYPPTPAPHVYAVGCSLGAAVLWAFVELYTSAPLAGFVFVDQAPLQDRSLFDDSWGPALAHRGCYDEATLLAAQRAWAADDDDDPQTRDAAHRGLVAGCLGYRQAAGGADVSPETARADEEFFVGISAACDGAWLARLMADHTRYDHRVTCELIARPVLVLAGGLSGCFSVEGMMETVRRVEAGRQRRGAAGQQEGEARGVVFEGSGHWLFYEEPERFDREVLGFVDRCERQR